MNKIENFKQQIENKTNDTLWKVLQQFWYENDC